MLRILSGVQPTGFLTLGNYLGAIRNWVGFQNTHDCLFCIVDLHALTVPQNPADLLHNTRKVAAAYIASGIDPKQSTIFIQSQVPQHSELAWLLNCFTPLGWLDRMTQFKDKAGKDTTRTCLGLYAYPVLMAADILLYKTTHVPVGEDQKQHIELARDIAGSFNHFAKQDFFPLPEPEILGTATRVMSLRDGLCKMSKSDPSDYSRINLEDDDDLIVMKIRKAKTDMLPMPQTVLDLEGRPEVKNLFNIYASLQQVALEDTFAKYAESTFSVFKQDLADVLIATIGPIRDEASRIVQDTQYLDELLYEGAVKARSMAAPTLEEVKHLLGLVMTKC